MIAFRLILLRIKFTTCATCHAFYLKRYQTSCSFCVYIVSTHHATILIASLILQIPASPTISTQRHQILLLHPILPSLPLSSSKFPTSPSISTQRRQILLLHPISPSLPLSSSKFPTSPSISTQRRQILLLHPILPSLPLSSSKSPPPQQSQHNATQFSKFPSIRSQFSTPFGSNPPIIPQARPLSLLHPPYSPNSLPHSAQIPL